jgi:Fe-S cluster assembly protein SufD
VTASASTEDGFLNLNAANLHAGLWIRVKEGYQLTAPIIIHHQAQAGVISHFRHFCVLEKNSSAQVVEYFDSLDDQAAFINHASVYHLKDHAKLDHYRLQCLASKHNLQSSVFVLQETHSAYYDFLLQIGAKITSCDLTVRLNAVNATAFVAGVFQGKNQQFQQQRVHIFHEKEHGQSEQLYRGMLDDNSKGVFIGEVYVAPHAIKTQAHQSNKNLLLGPMAEMTSCPQLQIFADDVVCSHGATVGQLEEDAIFYLQTRGINQAEAKTFLTEAFYHEPLISMPHDALRAWCIARLAERR